MKRLVAPGGPLGVFSEYPILLRFALICLCAETAWATLLIVMEFYFKEELLHGQSEQFIASKVAAAFLAFAGFETLFKYPMGALADRAGPRPFVLFSLGLCVVTPLMMVGAAMLDAPQWYYFLPMRALDGIAAAALWPAMSALMARAVPREAKAAAMSVFNGAYCLGLAIGPMTGLALGHLLGSNRFVFPLCTVIMLAGLLIARATMVPNAAPAAAPAPAAPNAPDSDDEPVTAAVGAHFPPKEVARRQSIFAGRPMLLRMMVLYALSQLAVGILAPTVPIYIDSQFGIKQSDLAKLIAIPAFFIVLIAIPLGRVPDTMGRARAVWVSYGMATLGMSMVAATSLFAPTTSFLSPSLLMFGLGILLLAGSYILGTPAWLGLTSLQVDDSRQAQAMSLMQTAQGVGVVCAFAMVAWAGHFMTQWKNVGTKLKSVGAALRHRRGMSDATQTVQDAAHTLTKSVDAVPLSVWFWIATGVFALCLVGTLLYIREPAHSAHAEEIAEGAKQPLEITGV